jgi:hypothetical protein
VGGVKPGDSFSYEINYSFPDDLSNWQDPLTNIMLTDKLPAEVSFESASDAYIYNSTNHSIIWQFDSLNPGASGSVTVKVTVGSERPPTGNLINTAKITSTQTEEVSVEKLTPWVKVYNVNSETWYSTIQSAITAASSGDLIRVWPGRYEERLSISNKSIKLIAAEPGPANTIIDAGSTASPRTALYCYYSSSLISGFTFTNGYYGIKIARSSPRIENCIISDCNEAGIYSYNMTYNDKPVLVNCTIRDNKWHGIKMAGSSCLTTVSGSTIENNSIGIRADDDLTVSNCIIRGKSDGTSSCGIYCGGYNQPLVNITNSIISRSQNGIYSSAVQQNV